MKVLLDTNAYKPFFEALDKNILDQMNFAETVYASVIVLGELIVGYLSGSRYQNNKKILRLFLDQANTEILPVTSETVQIYAEIKYALLRKGKPIPTNDIWIAAQAMETGAVLITYDPHFMQIPGLRLWDKLRLKQ